jgi:ComF family protein
MWKSVLNIFLKPNCPLCDRVAEDILCRYCDRQLHSCQLTHPNQAWTGNLPIFAWGKYEGTVKQSIAKLKYDGCRDLASLLGELLAVSWQNYPPINAPKPAIVVPIPLHPDKLQTRGFNQAELIARRFCQLTGDRVDLSLQRTRSTVAQFGLSKQERQSNVADAFALAPNSPLKAGTKVLLLDDIYTTGSTARSATAALAARGVRVCGAIVVATVATELDK